MGRYERVMKFGPIEEKVSTDMLVPAVVDTIGNVSVKAGLGIAVVVFALLSLVCKVFKSIDSALVNEG